MVALARKTLIHEWRRYLPASLAVAFSGVLLLVQLALVFGIFDGAAVYINASRGQIWAGYPGTQSIDSGRSIPRDAEMHLLMDPQVAQAEPFQWVNGDWRGHRALGSVSVFVSGVDTAHDALAFARVIPPALRALLNEPDAIIVDRADLPKLGIRVGQSGILNGFRVRLVGTTNGLRALGGVNIIASLATARRLNVGGDPRPAYYLARLRDPQQAAAVAARLDPHERGRRYSVWTASTLAARTVHYWLFETGAGLGVVFMSLVVFLVGTVITSQTLMGAVAGSISEYATLNALGASHRALSRVVMEQAGWVGVIGLAFGGVLSALVLVLAHGQNVPVAITPLGILACAVLVMGITLLSGLLAVRTLRNADPAKLLR